ncbi:hypothetical protein DENIS_1038 [Desulfonema ishimotonii]|uniref:DUF58 domain-containing protein n=1 Tax=Desulfonema ishimotonii TaxID=45657 RepID=A0A401FT14_9BACT|nr:DUF58 domain-containing protein [Desulfonema ishimotonii]GBC60094.1 hypothetical protein DENIS_1038 [Desulfonema ishimotonii]
MLSPDIIKKIKKIHFKSSRLVNTMMAGQYKSVFRGAGIEFEEVREYSPGDDVKSIDWKVSARLGRPFIKRYREEREQVVILLVDMSASGSFGTTESLKRETAAETAAILAFNAIRNNDKVGVILFTDRVEKYIPPKKGANHVWRVIREIFTFEPEHRGTDIRNAVAWLGRVCRKKTVSFLISDFLDHDYSRDLRTVSRNHEIIGALLSDPGEFSLPEAGILCLEDFETGEIVYLDTSDRTTRSRFEAARLKDYHSRIASLRASDIDCIEINTRDAVSDALSRYFRYREKRKR